MILRQETKRKFGYDPNKLPLGSRALVIVKCAGCRKRFEHIRHDIKYDLFRCKTCHMEHVGLCGRKKNAQKRSPEIKSPSSLLTYIGPGPVLLKGKRKDRILTFLFRCVCGKQIQLAYPFSERRKQQKLLCGNRREHVRRMLPLPPWRGSWSQNEMTFLKNNWGILRPADIAQRLERNVRSINEYARYLDLPPVIKRFRKGDRFGKLTLIEREHKEGKPVWKCQCDCGRFCVRGVLAFIRGRKNACIPMCSHCIEVARTFPKRIAYPERLVSDGQEVVRLLLNNCKDSLHQIDDQDKTRYSQDKPKTRAVQRK